MIQIFVLNLAKMKVLVSHTISEAQLIFPKLPPIKTVSTTKNSSLLYDVPSDTSFNLTKEKSIPDLAQHTKIINQCSGVIVVILTNLTKCSNLASKYFQVKFDIDIFFYKSNNKWLNQDLVSMAVGAVGE